MGDLTGFTTTNQNMKISLHLFLLRWRRIHGHSPYLLPTRFHPLTFRFIDNFGFTSMTQKKIFTHSRGLNYQGTQNFMNTFAPSATASGESYQYSHNLFPSVTFQCYQIAFFYLVLFGDVKLCTQYCAHNLFSKTAVKKPLGVPVCKQKVNNKINTK